MEDFDRDSSPSESGALPSDEKGASPRHPTPPAPHSRVSDAELRAFLAQTDIQKRVRAIIDARLRRCPEALRDDVAQQANIAVLTSKTRPRSMSTASGWLSTVTVRAIADYFRRESDHLRWLDPEADVDGEAEAAEGHGGDPELEWLVAPWLAKAVASDLRDQETYELLVHKARSGATYATLAADHATTEGALLKRIERFKKKYLPRYRRRRSALVVFALAGSAAVVLVVMFVWQPGLNPVSAPNPRFHEPSAVPSAGPAGDAGPDAQSE